MLKGILITAFLAVTGSAFAGDLSSVGTIGVEAVTDYSYTRPIGTSSGSADQVFLGGVQLNASGLGSIAVEAGDTLRAADVHLNYTTFAVSYANGFHLGSLGVVGALSYADQTGDVWFHGSNSSLPINSLTGTVELNAPLFSTVKGFVDYSRGYTWAGDVNTFNSDTNIDTNTAAVGAYVNLGDQFVVKAGYTRSFDNSFGPDTQGALVSVGYKF